MSYLYAWEKFHMAIRSLAGPGTQRSCLLNAYVESIIFVQPDEVPEEIQDELRQFTRDITRVDAKGDEGSVQATVNTMDEAEVDRLIDRIISMHDTITRHVGPL